MPEALAKLNVIPLHQNINDGFQRLTDELTKMNVLPIVPITLSGPIKPYPSEGSRTIKLESSKELIKVTKELLGEERLQVRGTFAYNHGCISS